MSTAVHIKWHGAQINFGDLPPYLTYDLGNDEHPGLVAAALPTPHAQNRQHSNSKKRRSRLPQINLSHRGVGRLAPPPFSKQKSPEGEKIQ